ncbi:Arc family DNA-binding protein [Proteus vulgaris]|uniref:Arc family DNA-binding protein n=1 Tax=Proteus vulgaris TaxID=585 RepID=UPI003459D962
MTTKQVKEYDKFVVRLPDGMRDQIAKRADENGRSMNSEIVQILQDALESESLDIDKIDSKNASPEDLASELARQLEEKQKEVMLVAKAFASLVSSKKK